MKLQYRTAPQLVIADKPAGFSTHSPDVGKLGLCEILEDELKTKLYVVHRLDKTTTGSLVFATSAEKAAQLTELFEARKIEKKYIFITAGTSRTSEAIVNSPIQGKEAETHFRRLKRSAFYEQWEARPKTGRQHQIRIHAQELGLSILGDTEYGGAPFPHLCLHAEELQIPGLESFPSFPPLFMHRLGLLKDPILVQWLSHLDRRQRLYGFLAQPDECLRLIHTPEVRADLYGSQIWFYWYRDEDPSEEDLKRCHFVAQILKKQWLLRKMQNRGEDPNAKYLWTSENWQSTWTAKENGLLYEFHSDLGQSPGLFLDQRRNRRQTRALSPGKRVLNLFSYTCGFSLNAAVSGASEVCSVDLSANFLKWGQSNFNLNEVPQSQYEFFQQESLIFLKGALKRGRTFDLIICDPPSFGRHKGGVFRIEQSLPELLQLCEKCLAPGGRLLFSCNFEKWDQDELQKRVLKILKNVRVAQELPGWDYELPNEEPLLKSLWIVKQK